MSGSFLENGGVNGGGLFFESAGSGEAVAFIHGFGLDSRMWAPQFEALQSTFQVIRYDMRGFGRSALPSQAAYAHEDDLNVLLSNLNAAPAHIVGLSMGGRVALRFAAAYPQSVRSVVLADSALDGHTFSMDWQMRWNGMFEAARGGQLAEAKRQWVEHPLFDPARANPSLASLLAQMVEDYSGWHWLNNDTVRVPIPPLAERLSEIRAPSLVITGERDLPDFQRVADLMAQSLPAARRVFIQGSGHLVNLEAPQEFNGILLDFLVGRENRGV
jgi:3-oxoadipate enol-lactonase